jgi:hypothetical protein
MLSMSIEGSAKAPDTEKHIRINGSEAKAEEHSSRPAHHGRVIVF